jgi:response regulator RpfG family c-di-GMP phosphodiesterase
VLAVSHHEAANAAHKQKIIFVVDDNDENLSVYATALEAEYRVMTMLNCEKMFALLERKKPDIILLKEELLGRAGHTYINRLKERYEWKDIPIIYIDKALVPSELPEMVKQYI